MQTDFLFFHQHISKEMLQYIIYIYPSVLLRLSTSFQMCLYIAL